MNDMLIQDLPEHGVVQSDDLLIIEGQTTNKITVNKLMARNFGDFADVEDTAIASKAYAVGDYLVLNGQFYKVTATIAQGNALTVGGNIAATNVGAEVSALKNDLVNTNIVSIHRIVDSVVTGQTGNIPTGVDNNGFNFVVSPFLSTNQNWRAFPWVSASNSWYIKCVEADSGSPVANTRVNIRYLLLKIINP